MVHELVALFVWNSKVFETNISQHLKNYTYSKKKQKTKQLENTIMVYNFKTYNMTKSLIAR